MENVVKVGMADLNVTRDPGVLITLGLGSCVGISLYDSVKRIIGMAHIMLPSSEQAKNNQNRAKFADTAVDTLLDNMIKLGADRKRITAKLAGGAQMFSFSSSSDIIRVGERNILASRAKLISLNIPIIAEDVGGNYGRTIEFYSCDGRLVIKTIGHGVSQI